MNKSKLRKTIIILVHAFVGWVLCGATMGIGMSVTSLSHNLGQFYHIEGSDGTTFNVYCDADRDD